MRLSSKLIAATSALLVVAGATSTAAEAETVPTTWRIGGGGFGHGVGMSQYGAFGQAREGRSATEILKHYFTGAEVSSRSDTQDIRVNLLHAVPTVSIKTDALESGGGNVTVIVPGADPLTGTSGDTFVATYVAGEVQVTRSGTSGSGAVVGTKASIVWEGTRAMPGEATLLDVAGPGESHEDEAGRYRHGIVEVLPVGSSLEVVSQLRLRDEYLNYVAEMPWSWPAAALQTQAISARSYALVKMSKGLQQLCSCHLYDTTRDQVFRGWPRSSDLSWHSRWTAAVSATAGQALTYQGNLIQAYYSSSTGGRTQNVEDVWGGSAVPYLRSVPDPWSRDRDLNPYARWNRERTGSQVANAFNLPDVVRIDLSQRTDSGSVKSATAWSSKGQTSTISGENLRSRLSLPSTWISRDSRRLAGANRYSAAAAIARDVPITAPAAVIVSGVDGKLADGVVAGPLAAQVGGPVLLSTIDTLPAATVQELERRAGSLKRAYVVGGSGSVSESVVAVLKQRGLEVIRVAGMTRYTTAIQVAKKIYELGGEVPGVVVASGLDTALFDALAASGPSAATRRPILLTKPDSLGESNRATIRGLGGSTALVAGGPGSVSDAVLVELGNLGLTTTRAGGQDRYEASVAIARHFSPLMANHSELIVSSGANGTGNDAIAGGALQRLMVLTRPNSMPPAAAAFVQSSSMLDLVTVVGGTGSVSTETQRAFSDA